MRTGTIVFVEIPVRDLARSADFYAGLFGWSFEEDVTSPRRWLFIPPGRGAMGVLTTERPAGSGGAVIGVVVKSIQAVAKKAIALGGAPGRTEEYDVGRRVEIIDPDGNHCWAYEPTLPRQAGTGRQGGQERTI